jgi:hypothetical protein
MGLYDLLRVLAATLAGLEIEYAVTGSVAAMAYGEARFTNDIAVVVELRADQVKAFCAGFPAPEFYVSPDAAREAIRLRRMFNVTHIPSGLKIDVIIPGDTEFERSIPERARLLKVGEGLEFRFSSPEDVILRKLEFYQMGGSDKHLRDIAGVLKVQGDKIARRYIADWAARLGVDGIWAMVVARVDAGS